MLYAVETKAKISRIPHKEKFDKWRAKISRADYQAIFDHLDNLVEGTEIQTSSWIPGSDWTGTVFQPIYDACNFDETAAAQFFGMILWDVMMNRDDCWGFGHYQMDGKDIKGTTYFKIDCP